MRKKQHVLTFVAAAAVDSVVLLFISTSAESVDEMRKAMHNALQNEIGCVWVLHGKLENMKAANCSQYK